MLRMEKQALTSEPFMQQSSAIKSEADMEVVGSLNFEVSCFKSSAYSWILAAGAL